MGLKPWICQTFIPRTKVQGNLFDRPVEDELPLQLGVTGKSYKGL